MDFGMELSSCFVICHRCNHEWVYFGSRLASLQRACKPVMIQCPRCHLPVKMDARNARQTKARTCTMGNCHDCPWMVRRSLVHLPVLRAQGYEIFSLVSEPVPHIVQYIKQGKAEQDDKGTYGNNVHTIRYQVTTSRHIR